MITLNLSQFHKGLDKLERALRTMDSKADKHMEELGATAAKHVMKASKLRTPVDKGELEQAHRYRVQKRRSGFNFEIYIDPSSVSMRYAIYVHELVAPGGSKKLGLRSIEKQASSGVTVGGKFLERAIYDERKAVRKILVDGMRKFMREATRA